MSKVIARFMVAGAILLGATSIASACPIKGKVVCTGTDIPAENVSVVLSCVSGWCFDYGGPSADRTDLTDQNGIFGTDELGNVTMHLDGGSWSVNLNSSLTIVCDSSTQDGIDLTATPFEASGPSCAPPPPTPADCSPGYYKKHPGVWDTECTAFYSPLGDFNHVLWMLSAEKGATLQDRTAAKAALDACFGTAAVSPCLDD